LKKSEGFVGRLWSFFTSLKLTIFLLFILAVTSISGTLIMQRANPQQYVKAYGAAGYRIIKVLCLYDVYHSWWFLLLLAFLALNLVICSIERFPRAWRFVKEPLRWPSREVLEEMKPLERFNVALSLDETLDKIQGALKGKGYRCEKKLDERLGRLFAQRGVINRLGVYVTHTSVLIILIGGLIGGIWGFSGGMTIVEGESSRNVTIFGSHKVVTLPFDVRCDSFQVTYYPGTMTPKDYRSTVTILENGKPVVTRDVRVNHPLKYKGISFYQASYGTISNREGLLTLEVIPRNGEDEPFMVRVKVGGEVPLKDGYKLRLVAFFPDLVLGKNNQPMNRSEELRNPAALLEVEKDGSPQYRSWVFAFFPEVHSVRNAPFRFRYLSFEGLQYTGLQVSKDPGVWVVWAGCLIMLVGLTVCFFISHRRVWVIVEDRGRRRQVLVVGNVNRNHAAFSRHFEELIKEMREAMGVSQ